MRTGMGVRASLGSGGREGDYRRPMVQSREEREPGPLAPREGERVGVPAGGLLGRRSMLRVRRGWKTTDKVG